MNRTAFIYVFDTMADWEIGFLTAELKSGRYFKKGTLPIHIVTLGIDWNPITTMGGLKILPDINLKECNIQENDILILPGGATWMDPMHQPIISLAKQCIEKNMRVAAICGATFALAENGLLDSKCHTSNDLGYLKMVCPNYLGESHYMLQPSVMDGPLITASGIAPLEFTVNVLKSLDVMLPEVLDAWINLYKTQDQKYFYALMTLTQG